jgi:opacity protein-like surface antigen
MKQLTGGIGLLLAFCTLAAAQEARSQITIQGSGVFTRKTNDSGVTYKPTSSGGIVAGYRFNITRWLGVEADYDYFKNTQKYLAAGNSTLLAEKVGVHAMTGAAVINIPNPLTKRLRSYVLAGGGVLLYKQRDTDFIDSQTKGAIVFGGGMDIPITKHILIRGQARTFMYKAPDFKFGALRTDKYTQTLIPSFGLVFTF